MEHDKDKNQQEAPAQPDIGDKPEAADDKASLEAPELFAS